MAELSQRSVAQLIRTFAKLGCYEDTSYTGYNTLPVSAKDLKRELFAQDFDQRFLERCAPQNRWDFDKLFTALYNGSFFDPPQVRKSWSAIRDRLEYLSDPQMQAEQIETGRSLLLKFAEYLFDKKRTLPDCEGWYTELSELLKNLEMDGFRLQEGKIIPALVISPQQEVPSVKEEKPIQKSKNPAKVWVVHGRDERLRRGLFEFLRSIGLQPFEFLEARKLTKNPNPYIGEILEAAFQEAQAVVVLLTPDDEGRLRPDLQNDTDRDEDKRLTGQARLNVIFEAGMAFVTHPKRTILGEVRSFSDVHGRHIVHLDDSTQKRQELASRLEDAGCPVNRRGTDWHTTGDLTPPPAIVKTNLMEKDAATLLLYKTQLKGCTDIVTAANIVDHIHKFFASEPLYLNDVNTAFLEKYPLDFREQVLYAASAAAKRWSLDELKRDIETLKVDSSSNN